MMRAQCLIYYMFICVGCKNTFLGAQRNILRIPTVEGSDIEYNKQRNREGVGERKSRLRKKVKETHKARHSL